MTRRLLPLAFVLAALPACGGTDDGRPNGEPVGAGLPLDPCKADDGYEFQNIADFEPLLGEMPMSTRAQECDPASACTFNFNYDVANTPPGMSGADCPDVEVFTDPGMQGYLLGYDAGVRCGEAEYATRLVERNLAVCTAMNGRQGWGGSLSMTFTDPLGDAQGFDASEWDGFSFWIKKRSSATRSAFIAAAVDPYTAGTRNIEDPSGGPARSCDASGLTTDPTTGLAIPDTDKCDGFGVAVTLTDDWSFVPVRFESMRQKGFGMPSPLGQVSSEELVRLQFLISAGDWDFWIDDVAFFRGPEE